MTGGIPPLFVDLCSVINDKTDVSGVFNAQREGNVSYIWWNLRRPATSYLLCMFGTYVAAKCGVWELLGRNRYRIVWFMVH
jgi:hypothetical protein